MEWPNRRSSNVAAQDAIAQDQPCCYTKECAGSQGASIGSRRDEPKSYQRRPFRQTAPVKCGGTGLPPPCGRKATGAPGSTVPTPVDSRPKGPPKTHQTAPVTCGDTGLPPPCH
ncbi:secreted protein [Puccinia sorghi]|uniref:Secreted protein n=1 Tax=Puccinia sorghi TaxID=27349 RepID=A0A0L6UD74_9BASI|nr:secreted protein [Puccinia sorghi]